MNIKILTKEKERGSAQDSTAEARLDSIVIEFVDRIIKVALDEVKSSSKIMEINAKVSSLRLSPGKRTHQDYLNDSITSCAPLIIFNEERVSYQTEIKTPSHKIVNLADPEQRHIWDKENYDPNTKQYSTDRKKKKVRGLSDKDNNAVRFPLKDITKKKQVVCHDFVKLGDKQRFLEWLNTLYH